VHHEKAHEKDSQIRFHWFVEQGNFVRSWFMPQTADYEDRSGGEPEKDSQALLLAAADKMAC
jgi:hypothetical protein